MSLPLRRVLDACLPLMGGTFPRDLMLIDCEYTDGGAEKGLLVEFAHAIVHDGQIIDHNSILLDWRNHPIVSDEYMQATLIRCSRKWETFNFDWGLLCREGVPATQALEYISALLKAWQKRDLFWVAHNAYHAEAAMIEGNLQGFEISDFEFGENRLLDSGAIFKAAASLVIGKRHDMLPAPGDTLKSYCLRVTQSMQKGVLWNLKYACGQLGLLDDPTLDWSQHHRAGFDVGLLHRLANRYRDIAVEGGGTVAAPAKTDPTASPAAFAQMFEDELGPATETSLGELPYRRQRAV